MDPRNVASPEAGATGRAAGLRREPAPATPMPRLAGKLRRGKSPEVTFYEDELSRRAAKEAAARSSLVKEKLEPKQSTERTINTKAGAASPSSYSKSRRTRKEGIAAERARTEPSFANYPGWQPYKMECPHEKGEMDRCHKDHRHMWHTQWPPYNYNTEAFEPVQWPEYNYATDAFDPAQWPTYYYNTDAFEPAAFKAQMPAHLGIDKSDVGKKKSLRRSAPRDADPPSGSTSTSVSESDPVQEKPMRTKSGDDRYKSPRSSAKQSDRLFYKDDGDDREDHARSPRRSMPRDDVKARSHAASLRSSTAKGATRSPDAESSSDDSENEDSKRPAKSGKSTTAKARAASRGTSKSSAATGDKTTDAHSERAARSQRDVPIFSKLKSTEEGGSSFGEKAPVYNRESNHSKAKSGRGTLKESQARAPRVVHSSESKPAKSRSSEESSGEQSSKVGRGSAAGSAKSSQRTVSKELGPSKISTLEAQNAQKSESRSTHSKSEESDEDDLENEHHLYPEKPGDPRSRKTSEIRNKRDVSHELPSGSHSGSGERAIREAAEEPSPSAERKKSQADLAKVTPSVHPASELSTSVGDAGSVNSHRKSRTQSEAKSSADVAAEASDPEIWARSSCSILSLANQVSVELAQKQIELMAERTVCDSPTDGNGKAADDNRVPPCQSAADTINVARQESTVHVPQDGGAPPVVIRQELCLYPLSLLLVVAALIVALLLFVPKGKPRALGDELPETCNSPHCLRDSAYLNELLNWNFDPCENFYMFVCSRWRNQFPATDLSVSADDDYVSSLEGQIRSLLEDEPLGPYTTVGPLQDLYNKCVNAKLIEDSGWDGLLEFMSELYLDGFPLTPPVRRSVSIWKIAARLLRKTGAVTLIGVGIASHPNISTKDVISVGTPETFTAIEGVDINDAIRLYTSVVFAAFKALRKDFIPPVHTLNVIKFASEVEKLSLQFSDGDARMEALVSASALQLFLAELFDGVSGAACTVPGCEVMNRSPEFIAKLVALVQETDLHTVTNFLGVRLMVQVAPFIPQSGLAEAYATLLYGKWRQADLRWKLCVRVVEKAMPPLFHRVSLETLTAQAPTEQLKGLVKDIVAEFLTDVSSAPYLDDAARAAIQKIVSTTRFETLAPTWIFNKSLVGEYAQRIPPTASERPLQSYAAVHEYNLVSALTRPTDQHWTRSIFTTNCWYERVPRSIYIPMLLFNLTLLSDDRVYNFQLSRAGVRISHCLLDMLFAEANSTDPEEHWLNQATVAKIAEAQRCFGKDNEPKQMRGAMALSFAYGHFVRRLKPRGRTASFYLGPQRNISAPQMFFVYLMLQSCEKKTARDETSPKSSGSWNTALRYQGAFPKEFRCPQGSPMNSDQRCNI
ncbi:hypothetical protein HPB50_022593 [Hyalomma asiaticum]|uniref:Uncharacterized protein n=1 Tax=Hyalomma asiaticum TaxID=266040 RepID=A0ACB7SDD7_HYAAI|nr:hypothetical protein HPB50_022593 [Hyalomma asiaticum]